MGLLTDKVAALDHELYPLAKQVARMSARCAMGIAEVENLAEMIRDIADDYDFGSDEFDDLKELSESAARMGKLGDEAVEEATDGFTMAAQEYPIDDEAHGYLFAVPVRIRGASAKRLSRTITKAQAERLASLLDTNRMVDGHLVSLFPRLVSFQELGDWTLGRAYELTSVFVEEDDETLAQVSKEYLRTTNESPPETGSFDFESDEGQFRFVALVGYVECDDPYDQPFPLLRATELAHEDLMDPDEPGHEEQHAQLHRESYELTVPLQEALQKLLDATEVRVLADAGPFFPTVSHGLNEARRACFRATLAATIRQWELPDTASVAVDLTKSGSGLMVEVQSDRGDAKKLFWPRLTGEPYQATVIELAQLLGAFDIEIKLAMPTWLAEILRAHGEDDDEDDDAAPPRPRGPLH